VRAAIYKNFQSSITIQNVPDLTLNSHGVIIKVKATGLCRSDWHGRMGHDKDIKSPRVPGHELSGTIEAIGNKVRNLKIGDRVTVPFVYGLGTCPQSNSENH